MTLELDLYEQAVIARLQPIKTALIDSGIPIALLPRKAYALGELEEAGHIAIAFPDSSGDLDRSISHPVSKQLATVSVEVKISLSDRYNLNPELAEATVTWALEQIIGLMTLYKLPVKRVKDCLLFSGHQLYAPKDNRWEAMARFVFDVWIVSTGVIESDPPITQVTGTDDQGGLFVAQ